MSIYLTRYFAETSIELGQVLEFNLGSDVRVAIRDRIKRDEQGVPLEFGFTVDVLCQADTAEQAIEATRVVANATVGFISISLSAVAYLCVPERVLDVTLGAIDRELVQYLPLPSQIRPSRKFNLTTFETLWNHFNAMPPEYTSRINRAMRWYRKALLEDETLDQFMNFWIGLEAINKLIKEKYGLSDQSIRRCEKCGADIIVPQTSAGIKYLIPADKWQAVQKVRNGLNHSSSDLEEIAGDVKSLLPVLQNALMKGILTLLDIPAEQQSQLIRQPLQRTMKPQVIVSVILHDLAIENIEDVINDNISPRVEIVNDATMRWMDETGRKSEKTQSKIGVREYEGTWTHKSTKIFAEKDPEDGGAKIELEMN